MCGSVVCWCVAHQDVTGAGHVDGLTDETTTTTAGTSTDGINDKGGAASIAGPPPLFIPVHPSGSSSAPVPQTPEQQQVRVHAFLLLVVLHPDLGSIQR